MSSENSISENAQCAIGIWRSTENGITASITDTKEKYEPKKNMKMTRLHVIPVGDEQSGKIKLHAAAMDCWCHPIEGDDVVTHNAFDCREKLERQGSESGKIWVHVLENKQSGESLMSTMARLTAGIEVAKQHAQRHVDDYGAKGSLQNQEHWRGFLAGVEAVETIAQVAFSLPNAPAVATAPKDSD